jgi:hypothetical protein
MNVPEWVSRIADARAGPDKSARELESTLKNHQPPVVLSITTALAERSVQATSILRGYAILRTILDRHEATIHRRWLNKSKKERRELVVEAWGTMPPSHRPDWEYMNNMSRMLQHDITPDLMNNTVDAFMWPYINQEDLTKPRSLLLFLASRGRNHPAAFAAADLEAMHIGTSLKMLGSAKLPGYTMMFTDRQDHESYGELAQIGTSSDAYTRPYVNRGLEVGQGLLILHVQKATMEFLNYCSRIILHEFSAEEIFNSPLLPAPAPSPEKDTGFASLAVMAAEAPYRLPAQLDFDRIVSLLTAKRDQAADHVWSLREDPGYFRDYAYEIHEHRIERINSESGRPNPDLEARHEAKYWTRVLWETIITDFIQLEMFSELLTQAEALRQVYKTNAASVQLEHDLPAPYMHSILRFRYFLSEAALTVSQAKLHVFQSPPWRDHYSCTVLDESNAANIIGLRHPCRLDDIQKRLHVYLAPFVAYKDRLSANHDHIDASTIEMKLFGMTTMMDGLQHLIESEPRAREMITPFIASTIGDLTVISECLHQLEIYQPWARTFDAMLTEDRDKGFRSEHRKHHEVTVDHLITAFRSCGQSLGRLGAPTTGFSYPVEERMTEENVTQLRAAESKLDTFWDRVDTAVLKALGPVKRTAIHRFLTQPRSVQRTPAWVPPKANKPASGPQILTTPFAELELNRRHLTEKPTTKEDDTRKLKNKTKTKTRGAAAQVKPQVDVQPAATEYDLPDNRPALAVDARSLKVLKTIFFTPSISATPGEIKWIDFLHAMVSVGFAPEQLYGSVWHFTPTGLEMEQSISFHEPHKEGKATGKIAYCVARRMGRRLTRKYGWDGSSFTLAEKKVVQ